MLCHGNLLAVCVLFAFSVQSHFHKRMADENENSAASGKFIFRLKLAGNGHCIDNAITENSLSLGIKI